MTYHCFSIKRGPKNSDGSRGKDEATSYICHAETRGECIRLAGVILMKKYGHIANWRLQLSKCVFVNQDEGEAMGFVNPFGYPSA